MSTQVLDGNRYPIPVLKPAGGNSYAVTVTATTARNATAIAEDVVGIYATVDMYIKIGDNTVEAAAGDYDVFLPEGTYREYSVVNDGYIAAIRAGSTDGTLYVNGLG